MRGRGNDVTRRIGLTDLEPCGVREPRSLGSRAERNEILGFVNSYLMRLRRKRCHLRAWRRSRELSVVRDRTGAIKADAIIVLSTVRNERVRLPFFLRYYRKLGVDHFLIVDNGSDDGSREYLAEQPDVSLWATGAGYKQARFRDGLADVPSAPALRTATGA